MSDIAILGAGAFGTALAVSLASAGRSVVLWGRDTAVMDHAVKERNLPRLPGIELSPFIQPTSNLDDIHCAPVVLLATPAQSLNAILTSETQRFEGKSLIACCKGIDLETGLGPWSLIKSVLPEAAAASIPRVLGRPSVIAAGRPD